jgi:hypothetical protein
VKRLGTKSIPIGKLTPYPGNPRNGDVELIKRSLVVHGQYRSICVRVVGSKHEICAGNHTYFAAMELHDADKAKFASLSCDLIECDDAEAAKIVLVDNRSADAGGYDSGVLAALLQSLDGDLEGTGYEQPDLDKLLASLDENVDTTPQLGEIEYRLVVLCDNEHHQAQLLQRLEGEGLKVQVLAG